MSKYITLRDGKYGFFSDGYVSHKVSGDYLYIDMGKDTLSYTFDDEDDAAYAAEELADQIIEHLKSKNAPNMDAIEFLNWTISNECHHQCIGHDKWVFLGADDQKTITTKQVYEIYMIWKSRR